MKTTTLASLVIITALTGLFNSQPIEALTLAYPTQDTAVYSYFDVAYANNDVLGVGRSTDGYLTNVLYSFDIQPVANKSVSDAYIEFRTYHTRGSYLVDFSILQNTSSWDEQTVLWSTAPQHGSTDLLDYIEVSSDHITWTAASGPLPVEQWVRMHLNEAGRAAITQWVADSSSNYGFTFEADASNPTANYTYFYSSNATNSTYIPALYYSLGDGVEQSAVPEPLSLFMLLTACIALIKRK